jgi:hypothetical protein
MKRDNFKSFYTNFMFNILFKYNSINTLKIRNKKICFDKMHIYANPRSKEISDLVDIHLLQNCIGNMLCSSNAVIHRNEASKPMMSIMQQIGGQNLVSSKIDNRHVELEDKNVSFFNNKGGFNNFDKYNKIYLKNESELSKMYTKMKHTISGNTSLKEYGDTEIITSLDPEDREFLKQWDPTSSSMLPVYITDSNNHTLINAEKHGINVENLLDNHFNLGKNIIFHYGKPA